MQLVVCGVRWPGAAGKIQTESWSHDSSDPSEESVFRAHVLPQGARENLMCFEIAIRQHAAPVSGFYQQLFQCDAEAMNGNITFSPRDTTSTRSSRSEHMRM